MLIKQCINCKSYTINESPRKKYERKRIGMNSLCKSCAKALS